MALTQTQISQLYVSLLGRASEGDGNKFWMNASNMSSAADSMLDSPAAKTYFGTALDSSQAFIEHIYENTLGKTYDDDKSGIDFWVGALDGGSSRGEIVASLIDAAQKPDCAGAAQDQFNNKVLVSNYTAVKIDTCTDLSAFSGFVSGVDDNVGSLVAAKAGVDAFAVGLLPHSDVLIPSYLDLDWVDDKEIDDYPHRAIGRITVENSSGSFAGTGFLIGPEYVLTNAHVLLDKSGEFSSNDKITFYPGQNGVSSDVKGYAWEKVWWEKSFDADDLYHTWPDNDLAVIKLSEPIGDSLGYFELQQSGEDALNGLDVLSAGYAGENIEQDNAETRGQDYYQWEISGSIDDYRFGEGALELSGSMLSAAGASGSPVFYEDGGHSYCVGVYAGVYGDDPVAATIDTDSYNWLLDILG
jgi:V8-like Glu-specific endopeptidase